MVELGTIPCMIFVAIFLISSHCSLTTSLLTFEQQPRVVTSEAGQNVVLNCKAEGSPVPLLHWEHNGQRLHQDASRDFALEVSGAYESLMRIDADRKLQMGATRSRLFLDCVTPEQAGEYVCVATIPTKSLKTTTMLRVDSSRSHSCMSKRVDHVKPARINMWTVSRLEYEGANVQLFCRTEGSPKPQVIWLNSDGDVIENNSKYQKLNNGDLVVKNVNWSENMGFYKCVARNDAGTDEVSIFLYPTTA